MTDHLRALTLNVDNSGGGAAVEERVELLPEARVYCVDMTATTGCELKWQDSSLQVITGESGVISWPISPGVRWPAHARFIVPAGGVATLRVVYGNCGKP